MNILITFFIIHSTFLSLFMYTKPACSEQADNLVTVNAACSNTTDLQR